MRDQIAAELHKNQARTMERVMSLRGLYQQGAHQRGAGARGACPAGGPAAVPAAHPAAGHSVDDGDDVALSTDAPTAERGSKSERGRIGVIRAGYSL